MKIGLIGLGKMGYNLGLNLMEHGHQVVAYDVSADAVKRFAGEGGTGVDSVEVLVSSLPTPKIVWLMVPAGKIVDDLLDILVPLLKAGDIVIEGGNSHYKDTLRRSERLAASGIHYMDVGTSGGMEERATVLAT
ncbi:hypothetical protein GCM10025857_09930 [Alicyclobacillus contaminans]|nr:hypothetical protein GCM10025857_09930 [Alicyclobacillus contaminans]